MDTFTGYRVTVVQRTRIGVVTTRLMDTFARKRVAVILCAGIAIITVHRNMDAEFFPVTTADVYRARVTVITILLRECAFAGNRVAGVFRARIAIIARRHIGAFAG